MRIKKFDQFLSEDLEEFKQEVTAKLQDADKAKEEPAETKLDNEKNQDLKQKMQDTVEEMEKQKQEVEKKQSHMEEIIKDPNIATDVKKRKEAEKEKEKVSQEVDKFQNMVDKAKEQQTEIEEDLEESLNLFKDNLQSLMEEVKKQD